MSCVRANNNSLNSEIKQGYSLAKVSKLILATSLLLWPVGVFAQPSSEPIKLLAGEPTKKWIYKGTQKKLGSPGQCEKGEHYVFRAVKTVLHEKCVNGSWVKKTHSWTSTKEGYDHYLSFRGTTYRVSAAVLKDEDTDREFEKAILRIDGPSKNSQTVEIILIHYR